MSLLSPHPGKRATERYWLLYTPVWGAATGLVMLTGLAETWGDVECLLFGLLVAAGALAGPLLRRPEAERDLPLWHTAGFKMSLSVVLLAFGLNYTQTPFFFDVLHMKYGFQTTWNIRNNPAFLYLVTVAYFATYCALCAATFRLLRPRSAAAAWVAAPVAVAFLETALNANPFMGRLFCYDDLPLVLGFGTLAYAVPFLLVLPVWMTTDERPDRAATPVWHVVAGVLAACYVDLLVLDLLRYEVAPHLTTVVEGAIGLRDYGPGSCLVP